MKRLSVILIATVGLLGIAGALLGGGGLVAPAPVAPPSLQPPPSIPLPQLGEGGRRQGEGEQSAGTPAVGTDVGQLAPEFELTDLKGQPFKLSELRGHFVLINFWASTCPYCRREMPVLQKFAQTHPDLTVVGVNMLEAKDAIETFVWDVGTTYRIVQDSWGETSAAYHIVKLPATFLLNAKGLVIWEKFGTVTEKELQENIQNFEGK